MKSMVKSERGVTLIELLVVVVILGIIAAVVIPLVTGNQGEAYANTNTQNLQIIQEAVERYAISNGAKYPEKLDDLKNNKNAKNYLTDIPKPYKDDGTFADNWNYNKDTGRVALPPNAAK